MRFDLAATDALSFSQSASSIAKHLGSSQAVLSIAKLCAHVASMGSSKVENDRNSKLIDQSLLDIRAQECLIRAQRLFHRSDGPDGLAAPAVQNSLKLSTEDILVQMIELLTGSISLYSDNLPGSRYSLTDKYEFINLILCVLSEQISCRDETDEEFKIEYQKKLIDVWAAVVVIDWPLFSELMGNIPGDIVNKRLLGDDISPGSLLHLINDDNLKEVNEGRLRKEVLLILNEEYIPEVARMAKDTCLPCDQSTLVEMMKKSLNLSK
jgi:hypothetical protein